ncbi:hypothetical protein VB773_19745 [Haloarculaceae archaeon H-GB2-1]|nr:hypothetical protein [Haloarculaceae archaeon H-GB1-1]MEA5409588.1 hypothetical protein [Haloarculaceae archaeon H-GB2-1]
MSQADDTADATDSTDTQTDMAAVADRIERKVTKQAETLTPFVAFSAFKANPQAAQQFDDAFHAFVLSYLQSHDDVDVPEVAAVLWEELRWLEHQASQAGDEQAGEDRTGPTSHPRPDSDRDGNTEEATDQDDSTDEQSSLADDPMFL